MAHPTETIMHLLLKDVLTASERSADAVSLGEIGANESSPRHVNGTANPSVDGEYLTSVLESQHGPSAAQTPPAHHGTDWFPGCLKDEVYLSHLQRNSDAPNDVPVTDRRLLHLEQILTHVHVVYSSNQSDP